VTGFNFSLFGPLYTCVQHRTAVYWVAYNCTTCTRRWKKSSWNWTISWLRTRIDWTAPSSRKPASSMNLYSPLSSIYYFTQSLVGLCYAQSSYLHVHDDDDNDDDDDVWWWWCSSSPSSLIWYWLECSNAWRLGFTVTAAYCGVYILVSHDAVNHLRVLVAGTTFTC